MKTLFTFLLFFMMANTYGQLTGLTLTGSAESTSGAKWTYKDTIDGITYDLQGVLFKPVGTGPFPSVIVNHGTGGSSLSYSSTASKQLVSAGFVCIATNYTHASISTAVPCGSPGDCADQRTWGAGIDNLLRAMKCWDILASLSYTDTTSIAAFGHSRGAFITIALAGTYPNKFSCFGHTAGGVGNTSDNTYASEEQVNKINKPYIFHQGDADVTVPKVYADNFEAILKKNGVPYTYYVYPGLTHSQMSTDATMYTRTKEFFTANIRRTLTGTDRLNSSIDPSLLKLNVVAHQLKISNEDVTNLQIFNQVGQKLLSKDVNPNQVVDLSSIGNGLYICKVSLGSKVMTRKILIF